MKLFLALLFALVTILPATAKPAGDRVLFVPDHPKIGDRVTVVYRTADAPAFARRASAFTVDLLLALRAPSPAPEFRQLAMTRRGDDWEATFTVENPNAALLLARFAAGDSVDDNGDNVWAVMISNDDGRPVRGAHLAVANLHQYGIASFKRQRNAELRLKELREELAAYPDDWDASTTLWSSQPWKEHRDSLAAIVRPLLERWAAKDAGNDELLARYPSWFEVIGDSAKARELRAAGSAAAPAGKLALESRMTEFRGVEDSSKLVSIAQRLLADFPILGQEEQQSKAALLLRNAVRAKNVDLAANVLEKMPKPTYFNFTQVAGKLLASGARDTRAETFARKALEMTSAPEAKERMYFKTEKEWKESWAGDRASALQTYASVMSASGKADNAEASLAEAYALTKGEDADIDQLYLRTLVANRKFGNALEVGVATIEQGKGTDSLITDLRAAFAGREGANAYAELARGKQNEFDLLLEGARAKMVAAMRLKVSASRISQPSVDFTLNDLNGAPVTLAALKGNVVILDFWATWCNPCKISFPFLKKVYDHYKANPKVTFLAVDAWERQKDYQSTVENARKFQADNKYDWTVLIDGDNAVVGKYEVEGIPTKFIIGADGTIAFKSVGFNGPEMVEELTQQIEILLGEMEEGSR